MNDKYEFTGETKEFCGKTLRRIRALKDFGSVKAGDVGGWIEKENNLSVSGSAWVSDSARVSDSACVSGSGDYITCGPIGRRGGITTIFRDDKKKVCVNCGCFSGTLDEFEKAAKATHGDTDHGKEYMALIALARIRFADTLNGTEKTEVEL